MGYEPYFLALTPDRRLFEHLQNEYPLRSQTPVHRCHNRNSIMKFHLQLLLLPILSTIIMGTPVDQSTDLESGEDINSDVELYAVESGHELGFAKRATPECSANCGKVSASDCVARIKIEANNPPDSAVCAVSPFVTFSLGNVCQVSFSGHKTSTTCISHGRLVDLATELLDACVNNPKVATGGCIDIENDGGRVCVRNQNAGNCF
jgi:hypothetical protein